MSDSTSGGNVPESPETTAIKTEVIEKPDSVKSEPKIEILSSENLEQKPKLTKTGKVRKPYTKKPGVKYGNPKWGLKKDGQPRKYAQRVKREPEVPVSSQTELQLQKKPDKSLFYLGIAIGIFVSAVGAYKLIQWWKAKRQSDKEIAIIKSLNEEAK